MLVYYVIVWDREVDDNPLETRSYIGCGGMAEMAEQVSDELGIPVIDGVRAAVKLIEGLHGMGLKTSKWGDYNYPIEK